MPNDPSDLYNRTEYGDEQPTMNPFAPGSMGGMYDDDMAADIPPTPQAFLTNEFIPGAEDANVPPWGKPMGFGLTGQRGLETPSPLAGTMNSPQPNPLSRMLMMLMSAMSNAGQSPQAGPPSGGIALRGAAPDWMTP